MIISLLDGIRYSVYTFITTCNLSLDSTVEKSLVPLFIPITLLLVNTISSRRTRCFPRETAKNHPRLFLRNPDQRGSARKSPLPRRNNQIPREDSLSPSRDNCSLKDTPRNRREGKQQDSKSNS